MPEIKNTFTGGRMNKDLDERLVTPGEYRDALNVSIGRSEGSDIGALENLKGNERVSEFVNTTRGSESYQYYEFALGITAELSPTMFTVRTSQARLVVIGDTVTPELVQDASPDNIRTVTDITNIRSTGNQVLQDITVNAPFPNRLNGVFRRIRLETVPGTRSITPVPTGIVLGSIRYDLEEKIYWFVYHSDTEHAIYEYDQTTNTTSTILIGDLKLSVDNLITGINIIDGMLFWTDDLNEPRKINIEKFKNASHTGGTTIIYNRTFTEADIRVIKPHPKEGLTLRTTEDVDADKPPFEEIFPQFAYRWKYDDGEYSPFSFFTKPAFVPGPPDAVEVFKEGYNNAVRNTVNSVIVGNIPKGTPDVTEVEVLYTESISSTIYTLKTIRRTDDEWGNDLNYIDDQHFSKRSFYSAVPPNQLLRPFDNLPRLAKSQEISANRLIYANYLQNFEQPASVQLGVNEIGVSSNSGLSVKGSRDYEVGVVFEDESGRQGALLTGDGGAYTSSFNKDRTRQLTARCFTEAPDWATHFKYYVKDTSMDHHNITCYNTFNDGEADNNNSEFMWLQIPSDDRNKISQDTFLVPRRHTHGDTPLVNVNTQGFELTQAVIGNSRGTGEINWNTVGTAAHRNFDRLAWVPAPGVRDDGRSERSGLNGAATGPGAEHVSRGVFTAPTDGEYIFQFEGRLDGAGFRRNRSSFKGNDFIRLDAGFQSSPVGENFAGVGNRFAVREDITTIETTGNANRDFSWNVIYTVELDAGDQVRPAILQDARRGTGFAAMNMLDVAFRTIVTPPADELDADNPPPPLQLPGAPITQFSRHKVIEIENEAPDIVRTQLPVNLRKLGTNVSYGLDDDQAVLTTGFNQAETRSVPTSVMGYTSESTELIYEAGDEVTGYQNYSFISPLNLILDRAGIGRIRTTEGIRKDEIDTGDQTISVDVSEVEGGLYLGVGGANTVAETGIAGKVRIREIAIGFVDENSEQERSVIQFTLDEPIGVNPNNQAWAIFRGESTESALKNLIGTFFVKIARATGNGFLPFLPTGQTQFDANNNVSVLQSIWFETLPLGEPSNLDLYWESTPSIPIDQLDAIQDLDFFNSVALVQNDHIFLETQRIFDRFNSVQMVKGVRVNIPQENYAEERRKSGLIYSGIYNSRTGVNRLNQFIQADGITKELEPNYGGIQKLHTRDTNIIAFCEDKIFKILADKDLLFNADGGGNVSAANSVLGQTTPYIGEYGISKNPESFATYGSRMYFADRNRGVILRLSQNGLEEITTGMTDFFRDLLRNHTGALWGSYDDYFDQYNIGFSNFSVSYSEDSKGWPSRKSFVFDSGLTLNNQYYTFKNGNLWAHNSNNVDRNNFYGFPYMSSVTTIFNQEPSSIKNFKTFNYEGTGGWSAPFILTDQEASRVLEFENKEGKWFNCATGLPNEMIVEIIESFEEDGSNGPLDFFDEDSLGDGEFGDIYSFNDDTDTMDMSEAMGLGDSDSVEDTGGGTPTPVDEADPDNETEITFNIT